MNYILEENVRLNSKHSLRNVKLKVGTIYCPDFDYDVTWFNSIPLSKIINAFKDLYVNYGNSLMTFFINVNSSHLFLCLWKNVRVSFKKYFGIRVWLIYQFLRYRRNLGLRKRHCQKVCVKTKPFS